MIETYGYDYFERGVEMGISGYSNYRWIPELTIPMCDAMAEWANIGRKESILDFGCAKGYVVHGFRLLRYECFGTDVSQYAIENSHPDVQQYVRHLRSINDDVSKMFNRRGQQFDWIVCKDVLEHVEEKDLDAVFEFFKRHSRSSLVIVPLGDGKKFNVPAYEHDSTHVIRQPIDWWTKRFESSRLWTVTKSFRAPGIKQNYESYSQGNGFFVLRS